MRLLFTLYALVCISMSGCRRKEIAEVKEAEKVSFTLKDFPRTDSLVSEEVSVPSHPAFPIKYRLIRDSLVLISGAIDTLFSLRVYDMSAKRVLNRYLKHSESVHGRGGMALSRGWQNDSIILFLTEEGYLLRINVDSLKYYTTDLTNVNRVYFPPTSSFISFVETEKDNYVACNQFYYDHPIYTNEVPPLFSFKKGDYLSWVNKVKPQKYGVTNISQAKLFYNPCTEQIWKVDRFLDIIRIYDLQNLTLRKVLCGPYHFSPQYYEKERFDGHISVSYQGFYDGYVDFLLTDQCVYLLFANECYPQTRYASLPDKYTQASEVYQLDWEGNLIHRYVLDRHAMSLDLDEKGEYFYCTVLENRRSPWNTKWVRYKIK